MKKTALLSLVLVCCAGFVTTAFANFWYPLGQIAKPSCRKEAWSTLDDSCKMSLPRIVGADYQRYKDDTQFRRIYTVLWGATYDYGWDVWLGSHLWVDLATSSGTPVLSIGDGTVVQSTYSSGWGNYITIRHALADGTNIYSNYAHLSVQSVSKGDKVTQWQVIWQVGNTGNSYGNHLHFQIDTTDQLHPYYYVTCGKGKDPMALVNAGECRTYLQSNTIDPIAFLETGVVGGWVISPSSQTIEQIQRRPVIVIEKTSIKSREEILNEEAEEYLKSYTVEVKMPNRGTVVPVGTPYTFTIESRDFNKNLSVRSLGGAGIKIAVDSKKATVLPENFTQLYGGIRSIQITPKTTGPIDLIFTMGKKEIARKRIYGIARWTAVKTTGAESLTVKSGYLGQEYDMYISPLTTEGFYVGNIPYNEKYRLETVKGKAKFCIQLPPKWSPCNPGQVVEALEFGKNDTPNGYYATRILPLSSWTVEFRVTRVWDKVGTTSKFSVDLPVGVDRRNTYYDAILAGLSKNWWKTRSGYVGQDMVLTTDMTREMIERVLEYRILKAGTNLSIKRAARNDRELFCRVAKSLPQKNWTRAEFADLLLKSLRIPADSSKPVWMDEKWSYASVMATLRSKYAFRWQDQFGERYFQPDKTITVAEALYLIGEIVK